MIKKMPVKIIHILNHRPSRLAYIIKPKEYLGYDNKYSYIKIDSDKWVGFFNDFHHQTACELRKKSVNIEIECWRPYGPYINQVYKGKLAGIKHVVFPSKHVRVKKIGEFAWSKLMLQELKNEIKNYKVILHIHDGHTLFISWLLFKLGNLDMPIIYQHRGGWFPLFDFKESGNPFKLVIHYYQIKSMAKLYYYYSSSIIEAQFLKNNISGLRSEFLKLNGIDFEFYKPSNCKHLLRQELGLPLNKIIILYVGRFYGTKGVDSLIVTFQKLKEINNDIEIVMVGGYKSDEFYEMAVSKGMIIRERMSEEELVKYYQASDIYVMATLKRLIIDFAGFGTASIQALACGLPVLSNNLIHFPGTIEERSSIGRTLGTSQAEMLSNIKYVVDNYKQFESCREVARKYFDINVTISKLIDKYNDAIQKYYPESSLIEYENKQQK